MISSKSLMVAVAVVAAAMAAGTAEAQSSSSSDCASKLVPCSSYLNSTNPPPSCCDPLREAVQKELPCLCNLFYTPGLLPSLGVNVTQALRLPSYCKIPGDLSACKATAAAPGRASLPSPPAAVPGGKSGNDAGRTMSWSGMSSVVLLLASMMLS